MFEVNVDECLMRLRYGRFILQAEKLFGKAVRVCEPSDFLLLLNSGGFAQAGDIVQVILDHGKMVPPEMFSRLQISDPKSVCRHPNDCARGSSCLLCVALAVYKQALHKLVSGSYLRASVPRSHVSPKDRLIKYEIEEKKKIAGFPTAKQLREAKEIAEGRIKHEDDEAEKVGLVSSACVLRVHSIFMIVKRAETKSERAAGGQTLKGARSLQFKRLAVTHSKRLEKKC